MNPFVNWRLMKQRPNSTQVQMIHSHTQKTTIDHPVVEKGFQENEKKIVNRCDQILMLHSTSFLANFGKWRTNYEN